jgi:hypothetical protein
MAGLGPAIHVFADRNRQRRGWPACAGHDDCADCESIIQPVGIRGIA